MTLDTILNDVDTAISKAWNNYGEFDYKEVDAKLRTAYPHVKCQEDFDKVNYYVLEMMALRHCYESDNRIIKKYVNMEDKENG